MTEIPTGNPGTINLPLMKRLLASQGLKDLTGGVSEMASQLISAPESSKMLLNFIHHLSLIPYKCHVIFCGQHLAIEICIE